MSDSQPRYTTKRLHDEIAKAKAYARREALEEAAQLAFEMAKPDDELWVTDLGATPETKIAGARAYIAGQIANAIQSLADANVSKGCAE